MARAAHLALSGALALAFSGVRAGAQTVPILPTPVPQVPARPMPGLSAGAMPTIIVGDPTVPNFPTTFTAINPNSPDSPLAGVVSVYGAINGVTGVMGSGVVLDRTHILTAAHVVDFSGGLTPEGQVTGDGVVDALMPQSRIYLNAIAAPEPYAISAIRLAPDWGGFRNAAKGSGTHDDLAIVTLSTPLPESVPAYSLYRTPFDQDSGKVLLMAGYGDAGDAKAGITSPATVQVKRFGWNLTAVYEPDDETGVGAENFLADFDRSNAAGDPSPLHTGIDGIMSVGNDFEALIAPGDSGGPAFLVSDLNGDGFVQANELQIFGLTTFTFDTEFGAWPFYGAAFGGPILSAHLGFIDAIVPEPGSLALLAAGLMLAARRR